MYWYKEEEFLHLDEHSDAKAAAIDLPRLLSKAFSRVIMKHMADSVVKVIDLSFLCQDEKVLGINRFVLLARSLRIAIRQADVYGWRAVRATSKIVERS